MSGRGKKIAGGVAGGILLLIVCVWGIVSSENFMETAAQEAGTIAQEALGTKVSLGKVQVNSWQELQVDNIAVYDKQDVLIGQAESAVVKFSPLAALGSEPAKCLREINVEKADVTIVQREDGSWNYEDLISDSESSTELNAVINVKDSVLRSRYNGQDITAENVNAALDMGNYPVMTLQGECENQGAKAELSATFDISDIATEGKAGGKQTFQLTLDNADVENYMPLIPAGTIPEETVKDIAGHISHFTVAGQRVGQELFFSGQAELENGKCLLLEEHQLENIKAMVSFNEKEAMIFASAASQGQEASAHGKITYNGGSPVLDLLAESASLDPGKIFTELPYEGAMAVKAHITGAADDPHVEGEVNIPHGQAQGIDFYNLTGKVSYGDSLLLVQELKTEIAGGTAEATGTFDAKSYDFGGNVKLAGISAAEAGQIAGSFAPDMADSLSGIGGSLGGDIILSGNANDFSTLQLSGSAKGSNVSYQGVTVTEFKTSFAKAGDQVTIDALSCKFPNGGTLGADGTLVLNQSMDLSFYASEADLSMITAFAPQVPLSGLLDIKGTVVGPWDNPLVRAKYAARDGSIYYQPFDRLHGSAGGNMQGVKINDFVMEQGEKTKWYAKGVLGFWGDQYIDMRVDTVGARMENIIQAVAPDQPLTGNVDNVITITGTLKNPDVVGYVHFYQGSYNGIFINGMDGDYYVKDQAIILQDFHVFTPWVDVDFNGTVDAQSNLDLVAQVHEIDLSRYNRQLPIPLQGKAQFNGKLTGTVDNPLFEGKLTAQDMAVNGQDITDVGGTVEYSNKFVFFKDIAFTQGSGKYKFDGRVNVETQTLHGRIDVEQGDIHSLVAMAGLKDNGITGTITGNAILAGTLSAPEVNISAAVPEGALGSYPLRNVVINGMLDKRKFYIRDFSGDEGEAGKFQVSGTVDLDGPVNLTAALEAVDIGALTESAGVKTKVGGTIDTAVTVTGTYDNPVATIPVSLHNLQVESTLVDSVTGTLNVADKIIAVKNLTASKTYNERTYSLIADGFVPFAALTEENPNAANQFDLTFALDNADLSLLPTLSQYIEWAVGPTEGRLRLQGTAARPYMTGSLSVKDGAFKIKNVVKPMTDMNVTMNFTGNTLTLSECTGKMGSGQLTASGFAHLDGTTPDDYNLDVVSDGLDIESTVYTGPLNANVNVSSTKLFVPEQGETIAPKVSGKLLLDNVVISVPGELPESSDDMPLVALDYTVELGKNVRFLSSSLGDLRLAGGAYFGGHTRHPNTSGSIYVTRGNLSYLKTSFKVYEGALVFGQAESLLPNVVLKAGTKINKTSVFLSLDGPVTNMNFVLTSNPKMSEADIIQLLTLRSDYYNSNQSDSSKFASALNIGLQMTILSEVETAMRNVLNLDLFTIERDTIAGTSSSEESEKNDDKNDYEVYNITLGKNITDNVLVKYSKSMTTNDYSYGVDYELSDKISLTYKRDEDNDYYTGVEARFTF